MGNAFTDRFGFADDEEQSIVQEVNEKLETPEAPVQDPALSEKGVHASDVSANSVQEEKVYSSDWKEWNERFGVEEIEPAPMKAPVEEEAGLIDQLVAGYKDLRGRTKFKEAVDVAQTPEDTSPDYEYEEGTLGAQLIEEIPDARKARIQTLLDESEAFRSEGEKTSLSEETMAFLDVNSDKTIWEAFRDAPVKIVTELGARSGAAMVPGLAAGGALGAMAGPVGFATGMGAGSARVDYAATIIGKIQEAGVDITSADQLEAFVNSPEMKEIETKAMKRAAVVGGMDALAGLVGAKTFTAGIKNRLAAEMVNVGVQMPVQAGLGAAGEAGGQLISGEELQPREIAAEAAGELITAPVDVAAAAYSGARGKPADGKEAAGPLSDLEKREKDTDALGTQIQETQKVGAEELDGYMQQVRDDVAAKGGDALDQEHAAAVAGNNAGGKLNKEVARLTEIFNQRMAADEEARYADDQVKEDEARAKVQDEAAKKYESQQKSREESVRAADDAKRVSERVAASQAKAQQAAVSEEAGQVEKEAEAARKTRAAEKADSQLNKLRKRRQQLGLEPKSDVKGTSPYASAKEVVTFSGPETKAKNQAMADAFTSAANEAATSAENEVKAPTAGQLEAGNYKKGHSRLNGLEITVESPAGSTRTAADGSWSQNMQDDYGYIKGTESAEGKTEQLDVFVGKDHASDSVFIVDQVNKEGEFDEHKVMMSYPNEFAARKAYTRNYPKGHKVGNITTMSVEEFKGWLKDGDQTVPVKPVKAPGKKGGPKPSRVLLRKRDAVTGKSLVSELKEKGGYTYDSEGNAVTSGYAVGQGIEEVIKGRATAEQIDAFQKKHAAALAKPGNTMGGWYDSETNSTYLDVSKNVKDRAEAVKAGESISEKAIQDLVPDGEGTIRLKQKKTPVGIDSDKDGNVTLHHYSSQAGLTQLDPGKYGTGIPGRERAQQKAAPSKWVDRTYFYMDTDHLKEKGLGNEKYTVKIPFGKLYDLDADPLGLKEEGAIKPKYSPNTIPDPVRTDQLIKDRGFKGFWVDDPQLGAVAAVFEKTAPEQAVEEIEAAPAPTQAPESFKAQTMNISELENVPGDMQRKSPEEMVDFTKKIMSGEIKPNIIVKVENGAPVRIVEGNHTLRVLRALGEETVEVKVMDTKAKTMRKVDNKPVKVGKKSVKVDKVEADIVAAELNQKLPQLKIQVLEHPGQLHEAQLAELIEDYGLAGMETMGLHIPATGETFVFTENHDTMEDLVSTILHEGVGHRGLRVLFSGEQMNNVLDSVYAGANKAQITAIADKYGLDMNNVADQRDAADELIARTAESDIDAGILEQVVTALRQILLNLGVLKNWSDSDIKALLRRTRASLKGGKSLSKIDLTSESVINGELVEKTQPAGIALRQMEKRIDILKKLKDCAG